LSFAYSFLEQGCVPAKKAQSIFVTTEVFGHWQN